LNALDARSEATQFFLDPVIAAVQVIDSIHDSIALRHKAGDNQGGAGS
jgi:hypothetical protein